MWGEWRHQVLCTQVGCRNRAKHGVLNDWLVAVVVRLTDVSSRGLWLDRPTNSYLTAAEAVIGDCLTWLRRSNLSDSEGATVDTTRVCVCVCARARDRTRRPSNVDYIRIDYRWSRDVVVSSLYCLLTSWRHECQRAVRSTLRLKWTTYSINTPLA